MSSGSAVSCGVPGLCRRGGRGVDDRAGGGHQLRLAPSAISGVVSAIIVLAVVVAVLGPALTLMPLRVLRPVVGGLLVIFGLRLRKAILRASGLKALHDEDAIYPTELAAAMAAPAGRSAIVVDWYFVHLVVQRCCARRP